MKRFLVKNWFLIGIAASLLLGFLVPEAGLFLNRGSYASNLLVVLLFLITGLKLPSESIRSGLKQVRLHLIVQLFIFVLIPLYFLATAWIFRDRLGGELLIGFYALACLPTTISSCIVFTQSAEGNVVATMFNAALSNVAGIFLSPIILSILLRSTGEPLPVSELVAILRSLALKMLLPIIVGQLLRRTIGPWVDRRKQELGVAANAFILCIIFFAFAKTAADPDFLGKLGELALPFGYLAISHLVILALSLLAARLFRLPRADRVTVLFTAPQKTLAMGVPLLSTFFGADAALLGVALLPLVFYHPWQLLVAGVLLRFLERGER